ncbi:hypothetical protein EPA93_47440 [Ktedonosporobacter rubrisoli]|uniref:site-specific DNA-methyltransferase (adenine-specific) n=1 Tax=Ktedonosporobacter rubrisoli TaxID=2509675 RepID=A0A4P6K4Q8_KTERU|nr:DNA methyltransferase [Ktedonosporobacter rubrisoli]QBD83194.1 hypothetical protein EPA93_47440 [Ktedonosporobacter rubrisoli]
MRDEHQESALNTEQTTRRFYQHFKNIHRALLEHIRGPQSERELYASLLLHRLMFIYFIQHKKFLNADIHYLRHQLSYSQTQRGPNRFYRDFLLPFFLELGTPLQQRAASSLTGEPVPYLNGNLFTPHDLEHSAETFWIADEAFENLFAFFDKFQWRLNEQVTPYVDEINPSILGYIFEQYVNQQQMGAYYTKEDISGYIAKNTIIPYLFQQVERSYTCSGALQQLIRQRLQANPNRYIYPAIQSEYTLPTETQREFITRRAYFTRLSNMLQSGALTSVEDLITYNLDLCQLAHDIIKQLDEPTLLLTFYTCLQQMTILDPTCGSGAFLLIALEILEPLYEACLEQMYQLMHKGNCQDFSSILQQIDKHPNCRYFVRKSIITHNLYGVDMMEQATEICKLRLFLKLLAQVERIEHLEPLPDIKHNIRVGNALIGFINSAEAGFSLPRSKLTSSEKATKIRKELDHRLALAYDINQRQRSHFKQWYESHKPFHWCIEFADIIEQGGFSVIIGNPPYVEYDANFAYTLKNFSTLPCSNLYPCTVERSYHLLSATGYQGMILPLAAFSTRNMRPFIEGFQRWFPCSWLSFYHFRPSMLFTGNKVASIPTVIYLAKAEGPERRFSTHLNKWFAPYRDLLFPALTYCQVTVPSDPQNRHYYPKFGSEVENAIMHKVRQHRTVSEYLAPPLEHNTMYYRSAGGLYWKIFTNFAWPYRTTSNKQCSFQELYDRDIFVALFNSSLFWWYYTVTFDTFNLKDYMLFGFRFSYPQASTIRAALKSACQQLMADYRLHALHLKRGETGSYTVYARKSKAIIDHIDTTLAHLYGFTNEELDFIINYDIKYRTRERLAE